MSENALIIVDMLNDFVDEKGTLYCGESVKPIVPKIRQRLDRYRENDETIIFLTDAHDKDDKEFERFPAHCVAETWGSQIVDELARWLVKLLCQSSASAVFFNTPLETVLKTAGVKTAEVAGVCTSICVMDTVGGPGKSGLRDQGIQRLCGGF